MTNTHLATLQKYTQAHITTLQRPSSLLDTFFFLLPLSSKFGIDRLDLERPGEGAVVVLITGKGEGNTVIIKRGEKEKEGGAD